MHTDSQRGADGVSRRAFTVEDVCRMIEAGVLCEHEQFELIEGDIVMLGHNVVAHELIKNALSMAAMRSAPEELFVGIATTLQLARDILVDPDLAVIRCAGYKPSESGFARPGPSDILLVVEIAAPNSNYDHDVKSRLYAHYGVSEFWLIEPFKRITWVHTGPTGDGWSSIVERGPTDTLTTPALPNFAIRLAEID